MTTPIPKFTKVAREQAVGQPSAASVAPDDGELPEPPIDADAELRRIARDLGFDEAQYVVSPRAIPAPDWRALGTHQPVPRRQVPSDAAFAEFAARLRAKKG